MIFTVIDQFRRTIRLTRERFSHIVERPEMIGQEDRIRETLAFPDLIKVSRHDAHVLCYYRWYEVTPVSRKHLVCIVKTLEREGFVITAFYTDRVKGGQVVWQK